MRQKKFYLALLIFLPIGLFSQTKEIKLQIKSLGVSKAELFVVSVIDSRDNTSKIGTSHYYNSKSKINLKNGATTSFLNLLRFNFPQTNNHIPLVIEIKELDITRNKTDNFDSISGQMELVFHSQINELIMELYSTKQSFAKKSFDGIKDIEEEIRNCIRLSFNEFIENNYETIIDYKKINSKLESAPVYTGNIILHKEYKEESPKPKQKKGGSYAIGITPSIGVSSLGGSLTFYNFNNKNDSASVIFPTVVNLDILLITPYFANQLGIRSGSYNYFKLGVNPLFRINKNAYLSCLAQFVFGLDSYKSYSNTTTNLAIGGYFSQGIYRMPKKGFYIGFGIYEFFSSSKIYPIDLGLKLEMGFRF